MLILPFLLPLLFPPPIRSFPLNSPPADCIDVICPEPEVGRLGLLEREGHQEELLDAENKPLDKCRECQDCTNSGYSVCVQPRHFEAERHQFVTEEDGCECAHSGPTILGGNAKNSTEHHQSHKGHGHRVDHLKCRLLAHHPNAKTAAEEPDLDLGEGIFRICYSSALRKLPTPKASNEKEPAEGMTGHPVLVTVSQFWLAKYWQALRPRHLHLFYVFPVPKRDHCEGQLILPSAQDMMWINTGMSRDQMNTSELTWLCKANLNIVMSGLEQEEAQGEASAEQGGMEDNDYYDNADPELPPEVQFERDVFAGADKVRFYYELKVHRENLLKMGPGGKLKFESRETLIKSDTLNFDLEPEIYGIGMPRSRSSSGPGVRNASSRIDRVNIEQHKMDLTKEQGTREPIVRPNYGRTGKGGGKSGERGAKTTMATTPQGTSQSTPSSSNGPRPIQSRPISDPVHLIDQSTVVPAPSNGEFGEEGGDEGEYTEGSNGPTEEEEEEGTSEATSPSSSKSPNSQIAGRADPSEEDWLLLRNVLIVSLILLAAFVLLALCYKRGLCCFPARGTANGGQQRNGKTRIQNGKKYSQTGK